MGGLRGYAPEFTPSCASLPLMDTWRRERSIVVVFQCLPVHHTRSQLGVGSVPIEPGYL